MTKNTLRPARLVSELFLPHGFSCATDDAVNGAALSAENDRCQVMSDMQSARMEIKLFGPPQVYVFGAETIHVTGARNLALIALLSRSGGMESTRVSLIDLLWTDNTPERGRANLRQLMYALRGTLGATFDNLFTMTRDKIALRSDAVELLGGHADGMFLEGLDLAQEGFEDWLRDQRLDQPKPAAIQQIRHHDTGILPRIMVMPFQETGITTANGLGDALAQELTGQFARSQLIDAISHFTSQTAERGILLDLNCDFALTGQCRLAQDRIVVDVSLLELPTNRVLWSDRYKASLQNFLAGEDGLAQDIAGQALRVVMSGAVGKTSSSPLPELGAHTLMISAASLMHAFERSHFHRAESQLKEVIYRCPEHAVPRAWLAQWHLLRVYQKWSENPAQDHKHAQDAINNALDLNADCPLSLSIDGNIRTIFDADFTTAQHRFETAHAINPSSAFSTQLSAVLATFIGNGQQAVDRTDRAFALSPRDPRRPFFLTLSAGSYVAGGRYLEAVEMAETSLRHNPLHLSAHRCRVIGLQLAGREKDARQAAQELIRLDPDLRVSTYQRDHPASQTDVIQTWANALKDAGVPLN
ncbi:MAG: hypothetical protein ABJ246_19290 [Paracoccaceae bacterium]